MANAGFDVVYSFPELTYFDFPAAPDPQEPGYYWGTRYLDAAKLYAFMPDKLAANASQFKDRQQHLYQADNWPLEKPQNIKGIQAQLWSETVRSPAQAWYRLLPRLAIMADKAWHKAPWEALEGDARRQGEAAGYAQLSATISRHWLARWDKKALPYRIGPVGAGQLAKLANQAIVGITIGAVSEALLLAAKGGADPAAVREALMGGFAGSRILELHGQRMIDRDFAPGAPARIQLKDMRMILDEARAEGLTLPLAQQTHNEYLSLVANGHSDVDHSGLLLELEHLNGTLLGSMGRGPKEDTSNSKN